MSASRSWATKTAALALAERVEDRRVAAARRVDRTDVGVGVERGGDRARVQAVGVGHDHQRAVPQRRPEAHLALLLAAEDAARERDEHVAGRVAEPLPDEVGGGGARRPVVDPDVGQPPARGHVGHQRDHRDPRRDQPLPRLRHLRHVRPLEQHAVRAAAAHAVQEGHDLGDGSGLAQVEPGPEDGGPQGGQLAFQGRAHGGGEPGRGLHDDVDEERAAGEADLRALPVELVDRLVDGLRGAGPHAAAAVEHAVDGGLAEARLPSDLAQRVGMAVLRDFCRLSAVPPRDRTSTVEPCRR